MAGLLTALATVAADPTAAAPLDALLDARPDANGPRLVEASIDAMNGTLDVLKVRARDADYGGTNVGDYSGGHLRAGFRPAERAWIEASLWQRRIDYRADSGSLQSWQLSGQWRLAGGGALERHAVALRATAWGNEADVLEKSSPTRLADRTLDRVRIEGPRDRSLQLDLVTTLGDARDSVSLFGGVQHTRVEYDALTGTATTGSGCRFGVDFGRDTTTTTQLGPCTLASGMTLLGSSATVSNAQLGLSPQQALAYDARVLRLGASGTTTLDRWRLRAGVTLEWHRRGGDVDALAAQLGAAPAQRALTAVAEVGYRVSRNVGLFARGTAFSANVLGEVPFLYNAVTASRFDRRYGYLSFGVIVGF